MHSRHLFLVAYDISTPRVRRKTLRDVQHHALGGQKSFYECWLSVTELQTLMGQLRTWINPETDRIVFVRLDARSQSLQLGQAEPIDQGDFFYFS